LRYPLLRARCPVKVIIFDMTRALSDFRLCRK